jgi:hypothetical protein
MCSRDDQPSATSADSIARATHEVTAVVASRVPESAAVCMAEVENLGRLLDQLETAISFRVARVDASGEARGWGYPSTTAWLRHRLGTRHSRAVERVVLARQLPRLTQVAKRLATRQLSHGYATAIACGVKYLDDHDTAAAESILLDLIDEGASVADVNKTCTRINDIIAERDNRDTRSRAQRRGYRRSWLSVTTDLDGRGAHVTGWLTATHASMLRQACAPLAVPAGAHDDRDHPQRFADALYARLSKGGRAWNATIVIDAGALTNNRDGSANQATEPDDDTQRTQPPQPGWPPAPARPAESAAPAEPEGHAGPAEPGGHAGPAEPGGHAGPADPGGHAGPAEAAGAATTAARSIRAAELNRAVHRSARTLDGLLVSAEQARQIALNAGISPLIVGPGGLPLYLGRKTRLVTPAQHKTLMALYDTCVADGCIIPAYLCQIDHVKPWIPEGLTNIDNLAPECAFHNRFKSDHPDRVHLERRNGRWRYRFHHPPFHRLVLRVVSCLSVGLLRS